MSEVTEALSKINDLVTDLATLRGEKAAAEQEVKFINGKITAVEENIIAMLTEAGLKTFDGTKAKVTITERISFRVPKDPDSRAAFFEYLRSRGVFDELITVNAQTLNKFCKTEEEVAVENGEIDFRIPGIETPTIYNDLTFRSR